jgi:hypothetical protein
MRRSIVALVSAIVAVVGATTIVDIVLHAIGVFPPPTVRISNAQAALATSYRVVFGVAGAWLTARLAPANPMKHVTVLGVLGTMVAVIGVIVTWNLGLGPHWYPIVLAALALPQSWLGGRLAGRAGATGDVAQQRTLR